MKVLALRADAGGCAHYRILRPAEAVSSYDPTVQIRVGTEIEVEAHRNSDLIATVRSVNEDIDLLILQRPLDNAFTAVIEQAQRQGIACVVELDDDFESIHRLNRVWKNVQPSHVKHSNFEWLKRACELADHVTVSTQELAKYAPHGRVTVLDNYMHETDLLPVNAGSDAEVRVGWSGTLQVHPTDLQVSKPGLAQAVRDTGAIFSVVGDGEGVREAVGLPKYVQMQHTGWVPLSDYIHTVSETIDVGVVPLDDITFNRAKSWLKGLEFAAVGKPFVASPLPEYRRLHDDYGIGLLAETPSQWRRLTRSLIEDRDMRVELGSEWQNTVRHSLLYSQHASEWLDAWSQAVEYRRSFC